MSTTDDETTELTESAAKLMNWARNLATMNEEQYLVQYRKLSAAAKRQLLPVIRYHQTTCLFPWRPPVSESVQEQSPPITHAVPSSSRDGVPCPLPHPEVPTTTAATDVNMNTEEENANNNQQEAPEQTPVRTNRTNRRRRASANSNDSYEAPRTVNRQAQVPVNEYEEVQRLLRTFGQKRKYQRYADSRPVPQPSFATAQYNELLREQITEEEEMIAKLYIEIKENLYLAYENESRSNHHHFVVAGKLVMLKERVGVERFDGMLANDFALSKK